MKPTMLPIHKSNLARLALLVLDPPPQCPALDMRYWTNQNGPMVAIQKRHECGTTACFLGHATMLWPETMKAMQDTRGGYVWGELRTFMLGLDPSMGDSPAGFLFAPNWPDDRGQCARRALVLLEKGEQAEEISSFISSDRYLDNIKDGAVARRLRKFVIATVA